MSSGEKQALIGHIENGPISSDYHHIGVRYADGSIAGHANMQWDYEQPYTARLLNLELEPGLRGEGFGTKLFKETVKAARDKGFELYEGLVSNERLAASFGSSFGEENLSFARFNHETNEFEPLDASLQDVIAEIQNERENYRATMPELRDDEALPSFIRIRAALGKISTQTV